MSESKDSYKTESELAAEWRSRTELCPEKDCGMRDTNMLWHFLRHHCDLPADFITVTRPHYKGLLV